MKKSLLPYFIKSSDTTADGANSTSLQSAGTSIPGKICAQNIIHPGESSLASFFPADADDVSVHFREYHPNNSTLRERNPHYDGSPACSEESQIKRFHNKDRFSAFDAGVSQLSTRRSFVGPGHQYNRQIQVRRLEM